MTPEFPQNEREKLEAKLTAFLLGELSPDETVTLCKAMEQDRDLAALYERLKLTVGLVRESAANPTTETASQPVPLKLSEARREKLLAHFKSITPKEFAQPRRKINWLVSVAAVLVITMALAALLLPSKAKIKTMGMAQSDQESEPEFGATLKRDLRELSRTSPPPPPAASPVPAPIAPPPAPKTEIVLPSSGQPPENRELAVVDKPNALVSNDSWAPTNQEVTAASYDQAVRGNGIILPAGAQIANNIQFGLNEQGQVPQHFYRAPVDANGSAGSPDLGITVTNGLVSDPAWAGVLDQPNSNSQSDNHFIARYAFGGPLSEESNQQLPLSGGNNIGAGSHDQGARGSLGVARQAVSPGYRRPDILASSAGSIPFTGQLPLETNGGFYTGLTRDDVSGTRYVFSAENSGDSSKLTDGYRNRPFPGSNSQALAWNSFDASTGRPVLVDPDTHNLILSADADTSKAMKDIIARLDNKQSAGEPFTLYGGGSLAANDGQKADGYNLNVVRFQNASPSDISGALKKPGEPTESPKSGGSQQSALATRANQTSASGSSAFFVANGEENKEQFDVNGQAAGPVTNAVEMLTLDGGTIVNGGMLGVNAPAQAVEGNGSISGGTLAIDSSKNADEFGLNQNATHGGIVVGPIYDDSTWTSSDTRRRARIVLPPKLQDQAAPESSGAVTRSFTQSTPAVIRNGFGGGGGGGGFGGSRPAGSDQAAPKIGSITGIYTEPQFRVITNGKASGEIAADERHALGFDWYLGNYLTHSASGGSQPAPSSNNIYSANVVGYAPLSLSYTALAALPSPPQSSTKSLETRTFKVDPNTFYMALQTAGTISSGKGDATTIPHVNVTGTVANTTNAVAGRGIRYVTGIDPTAEIQTAAVKLFDLVGVDLAPGTGKSVFFNDRQGTITIRGTADDLDLAQAAIDTLNIKPPEVVVATKFVEVNSNDSRAIGSQGQADQATLREQNEKVREAQAKVEELRKGLNIPDSLANSEAFSETITAKTLEEFSSRRVQVEADYQQQLARLQQLKSLDKAQLEKVLPTAFTDSQLNTLLSELDAAQQNLVRLKTDNGEGNPKHQIGKEAVDDLTRKVDDRIDGIMAGLQVKADASKAALDSIDAEIKDARQADIENTAKTAPYFAAKAALENEKKKRDILVAQLEQKPAASAIDTAPPKPVVPLPTPQPEILTRENAFSTFSLNVSDVSFKLAAASLEKGQMPDPGSIRSEEFINAFDYRDPEAAAGVPIAFASERARYPFAQNREMLRFSLKTAAAGRQGGRPLNIVLLLDNSGSMERADRVRIIQEALRVLTAQLQPQDTFSIVTFARTPQLRVDGVPGNQAAAAADAISKLTPEGGTNLGDALDVAYETALHHYFANGDNRVVMLTDGAANLGDVDAGALKQKVETHRKQGVALDCFGIGWEGYNDDLLETLTRNGDGRYGFINTPEEAGTEFATQIAGALHVAASDVKVQVEFNPNRVVSYRQIGYAKHQLTKEQFRDNTVNAAPMASQEAGNALYTIETNPQGDGSIATVHVRYRIPGTVEYREQAWDVPYAGNAVSLEQASAAMRLATTASAFSEWLATSPFAEEVTTDQLLNYLTGVPQVYGADTRPTKLEWMIRQAKSISGK